MPDIFKAQIAQKIAQALGPLVFDATLVKERASLRTDNPTGGTHPITTSYAAKGWVDGYRDYLIDGTIIQVGDRKITLLGASLSVEPEPGDLITIEGQTRRVVNVFRDPASATYECQAR